MPRTENPIDPNDGPLAAFAADLRALRERANRPPYRVLARRSGYAASTLSLAAAGTTLPSLEVTLAYVQACDGDPEPWLVRWQELAAVLQQPSPASTGAGESVLSTTERTKIGDAPAPSTQATRRNRWLRTPVVRLAAVVFVLVAVTALIVSLGGHTAPAVITDTTPRYATGGGGPFRYDETTGPGCIMVFATGRQEQVAQVEPDNSVDLEHAWVSGQSDEPHWALPNCTNTMLYSQPSTEANRYQWQNDYVWKFFDVPSGIPCTFHIYIADSPLSKYNATYDWTNGQIVGDWVDGNAFPINQAAHVGSWYSEGPHTYTTGMAYLMLTDQRGDNPPSADAPLTASEVRLTCS
jgi:hypothetical protein